jgi:hypothetical protein
MEREVMTEKEAAAYLRMSVRTLQRLRRTGKGPRYSKPVGLVTYTKERLVQWRLAHEFGSTSEETVKRQRQLQDDRCKPGD